MLLFAALRRSERSFSLALLKKQPQVFENNRWDGTIVFRIISAVFFAQKKRDEKQSDSNGKQQCQNAFEIFAQALCVSTVCPHVINRSVPLT